MTGLVVLIPVALFLGLLGLAAFLWSLKSGQFDDLDGAGERILLDAAPETNQRGTPADRGSRSDQNRADGGSH